MSLILRCCMSITKNRKKFFPNHVKPETLPEKVYPAQYPKNITDKDTSIISHTRPVRLTSPKHEVPFDSDLP